MATSPDVTYHLVQMGLWTYAELATGVIISCLPVIPKFFQHLCPSMSASICKQARVSANHRRRLNHRKASTHNEAACGCILPHWTTNSRLDHPETLSIASSHRAYLNRGDYSSNQFKIARSDIDASQGLDRVTLARPAKTRNNPAGRYQKL